MIVQEVIERMNNWVALNSYGEDSKIIDVQCSDTKILSRMIMKKSAFWIRENLVQISLRFTLENVSIFAFVLALLMPRVITYLLVYPIFRLVFGTLYPAYASYKAVRTKNVKEYVKWMMYWIVFALFTSAETFTDVFFSFWLPFYYEIKIILVLWLLSPATKGSSILYRRFVHPALSRREAEIDDALARATEQGYAAVLQLGTKGVNYATTVLMQTAIKGGGGLVQQLKKSYSLSDLTAERDDENQNPDRSPDEVDLNGPRRRVREGRRDYSPRRTQSSNNRMDLYFSEIDVEMRKSRSRECVGNLTNIKSSDDISSGYSSGEALHSQRNSTNNEHLVRTASVGGRNRIKPRSATKKSPEVEDIEEDEGTAKTIKQLLFTNSLSYLTINERSEILSFLSQNMDCMNNFRKDKEDSSDSDDNDSSLKVDPLDVILITRADKEGKDAVASVIDVKVEEEDVGGLTVSKEVKTAYYNDTMNNVNCSHHRLDELKELLQNAEKVVNNMVSSQDNLNQFDKSSMAARLPPDRASQLFNTISMPSISRSNPDCSERSGKYHKKRAPKIPEIAKADEEEVKALKATLVLKTGLVKAMTGGNNNNNNNDNNNTMDAAVKRKKKVNKRTSRDGLSKFLTIPKCIFYNTFHKMRDDDLQSTSSERSVSRSSSRENVKSELDVTSVLLDAINEERTKSREGDTYINLRSNSIDCDLLASRASNNKDDIIDGCQSETETIKNETND